MRVRNKAKGTTPTQQVFSNGFAWFCKGKNVEPVSVLSTSCEVWLNRFFGVGSERGHTTLHPHKTDECETCGKLDGDIDSVVMSIKRFEQQHDKITIINAIADARAELADLEAAKVAHLHEAHVSQEAYKSAQKAAPPEYYADLTARFNGLARSAFTPEVKDAKFL